MVPAQVTVFEAVLLQHGGLLLLHRDSNAMLLQASYRASVQ